MVTDGRSFAEYGRVCKNSFADSLEWWPPVDLWAGQQNLAHSELKINCDSMYKGRTSRPRNNLIIKILDTTLQSHCSAIREAQEPGGRLLGTVSGMGNDGGAFGGAFRVPELFFYTRNVLHGKAINRFRRVLI